MIPGLEGNHGLDSYGQGWVLLEELRCAACHEGVKLMPYGPGKLAAPPGPDLTGLNGRMHRGYLTAFLLDPHGVQPGTRMPHLLEGPHAQQDASDLAIYLELTSGGTPGKTESDPELAASGERLFHEVGCVACHDPQVPAFDGGAVPKLDGSVSLAHVPAKYPLDGLAEFLFAPHVARPAGRMPDFGLNRSEASALAHYLLRDARAPFSSNWGIYPTEQVERGRKRFQELGCAACHANAEHIPPPPKRDASGWNGKGDLHEQGCLSPDAKGVPRFALSEAQRLMIGAAQNRSPGEVDPTAMAKAEVQATLVKLNCIACHTRDDFGGPGAERDPYFHTNQHDLGDHARMPPTMTLAGAKLQPEWLAQVLYDGRSVRNYMHTRMPRFGEENVQRLPTLFAMLDEVEAYPFKEPSQGDEDRAWRDGGRDLMGTTGLACVSCHDFNGKPSLTFRGVDLITTPERIQFDWFARFLIDPEAYRPGIVMPQSWPGGVAAHDGILEGHTETQIQALWHFYRLGRSAPDPKGLAREHNNLDVTDRVLTYRGRSRVAGFRGIAVGYPGGLNYAFDANHGTLAALWKGDFVSVNWQGQGAGDFNPRGRAIQLHRDVAFWRLPDDETPWPAMPVKTEEAPVDPDPTYGRRHGYRFLGYHLDGDDVPTLRYRSGDVLIEDRLEDFFTGSRESRGVPFMRRLTLTTESADRLHFRLFAGDSKRVDEKTIEGGGLRITLPDVPVLERPSEGGTEWILTFDLEPGTTEIVIGYELL